MIKKQCVRDPVHGLIVFEEDELDQLAWQLIDTAEFQRLRRIKQLGVSEFVFPGATHTRFAHSIGVFHVARELTRIIKREIKEEYKEDRAEIAVIAALLHDLGHGPFSHTFEGVLKSQQIKKKHEKWTAEIILNPNGEIRPILDAYKNNGGAFAESVAKLLESEDPADVYHAVVSSSFDADRLDYLRRDKLMTGTGAGAIDFDWLLEHLRVTKINLDPDAMEAGEEGIQVPTFCLHRKALPAAEQFLLSRYTLHEQVYFHKTTRCIEHMIAQLLNEIAVLAKKDINSAAKELNLNVDHPLLSFFGNDGFNLENYMKLDDIIVMAAFERMVGASNQTVAGLAKRLRDRDLYKTLDIRNLSSDDGRQRFKAKKIDEKNARGEFEGIVLKDDTANMSIYSQIGGEDEKAHKRLMILEADGPQEISKDTVSRVINALLPKKPLTRYYFEKESDRDSVTPRRQG